LKEFEELARQALGSELLISEEAETPISTTGEVETPTDTAPPVESESAGDTLAAPDENEATS